MATFTSVSIVDSLFYGTEHTCNDSSLRNCTCETHKLVALLPDCNLAAKKKIWKTGDLKDTVFILTISRQKLPAIIFKDSQHITWLIHLVLLIEPN